MGQCYAQRFVAVMFVPVDGRCGVADSTPARHEGGSVHSTHETVIRTDRAWDSGPRPDRCISRTGHASAAQRILYGRQVGDSRGRNITLLSSRLMSFIYRNTRVLMSERHVQGMGCNRHSSNTQCTM